MAQDRSSGFHGAAGDIPAEVAAHLPLHLEPYFLVFLVSTGESREMSFQLFVRHQAYMRDRFDAGVYRLAGPLAGEGRIRGMIILEAGSAQEARAIAEADPAVQEGNLRVEVHRAIFPSLDSLRIDYPEASPSGRPAEPSPEARTPEARRSG